MAHHSTSINLDHGLAPDTSYWAGVTREELSALVAARRHQQAIPSEKHIRYDPMVAATADLSRRLALSKARADLRRRVIR